ncbi:MAG: nuclear transport factor 2 family protein [Acidimicrobiia bacterium]|nr:nuclear transport factor 2 family protein [Acidimicrobiia bacterium]
MSAIDDVLEQWHRYVGGDRRVDLADLIHPDCVFHSPVVYTPQEGRAITVAYLEAAGAVFGSGESSDGGFRYRSQIVGGDQAVLEFESELDGIYINGIDMITLATDGDHAGTIIEFKVMVRPLQAVNKLHQLMASQLESDRS